MKINITSKDEVLANAKKELDDDIVKFIDECVKDEKSDSFLISVLHKVQDRYGYLPKEKLQAIAYLMKIPSAKVSGVASFYHYFRLTPKADIIISICMGTACFVKGAEAVGRKFKEVLAVDYNQITSDGKFMIMETRCLGMCAMAPVVKIGDDIYSKVTPEQVKSLLEKY